MDYWIGIAQIISGFAVIIGFGFTIHELIKNNRLQKLKFYTQLEFNSVSVFNTEISNPEFRHVYDEKLEIDLSEEEIFKFKEYIFSLLNLFEIQFKLRRNNNLDPVSFASWIPWLLDASKGELFRKTWHDNKYHYIPEFRDFMNRLIEIIEKEDNSVEQKFYDKASEILDCKIIKNWLNE